MVSQNKICNLNTWFIKWLGLLKVYLKFIHLTNKLMIYKKLGSALLCTNSDDWFFFSYVFLWFPIIQFEFV
jgi:hypothetical protein